MGSDFRGCFDLYGNRFLTSGQASGGAFDKVIECESINDARLDDLMPGSILTGARESADLAMAGYEAFDRDAYRAGNLTPVVFGSALKDYGVEELLKLISLDAPEPRPSPSDLRVVHPGEDAVTGFVFKVQANMDPNHRDRVAFLRLCSGHFQRGMKLRQVRTGKDIVVHSPIFFLARDREITDEAGPGDVIGIPNHGTVRVGDTFTEGEALRFTGLPAFAPEILRRARLGDVTRVKQLRRALEDMAEEGLIQVFKPAVGSQWIFGVVGVLQLDVLKARLKQEYNVEIDFEPTPFQMARWLHTDSDQTLKDFVKSHSNNVVTDRDGAPVFLAKNAWELDYAMKNNEAVAFLKTKELD
jgi:peptide chain release factor 3